MPGESATSNPIELTHRAIAFLNSRDLDAVMGLLSSTCVRDMSRSGLDVYMGAEAIRAFSDDWLGALYVFAVEVDEIEDLGNGVVYVEQVAHRERTPGSFIELPSSVVALWDGGLLAQVTMYPDPDEARAAAERLAEERG
jgi:hypothetical protein